MQTFLPYRNFESSARVLDRQRLGKQRVETLQIMKALATNQGWVNHPVTKMWRGYEFTLMSYQQAICDEWTKRGYNDTCLEKTREYFALIQDRTPRVPPWLGLRKFHAAHRANLLRKSPTHYNQYGWKEKPAEGYWYPPERKK
jgi:hypothetical protein